MSERKNIPIVESYNENEEFLYNETYMFIKGYAVAKNLKYTLKALPFARKIHNGQYRKNSVIVNGIKYQLPYILHVLKVCSTLISLSLPLEDEELDIMLMCALLHDTIEDAPDGIFKDDGHELVSEYGFPEKGLNIIKLLSKCAGATHDELNNYFNSIKKNKIALLVKMADRSHNVEDLYNMKPEKLHKYVLETREFIYPLATYAKANYPELSNGITILKSKIVSLTELTETIVEMYDEKISKIIADKDAEILKLKEELS